MERYNTIKVALIGASGAGKTCLARAITKQKFDYDYIPTIGSDMCHLYVPEENFKILIWDLSGFDKFDFLVESYIKTSDLVCFCYDSNQFDSYEKLKNKFMKVRELTINKPACVVATKNEIKSPNCDWGMELSIILECPYFVTSALKGRTKDVLDWILEHTREKYPIYLEMENKYPRKKCLDFCNIF